MSRLRPPIVAFMLATLFACDPSASPVDTDPSFAKEDGGPIRVLDTDPGEAPQDTTLAVRIFGSGFSPGSSSAFLLGGVETPGVVVLRTRFVSETELEADVAIALDADIALYDVEVTSNGRRRRGVGTELFSVVQKTNNGQTEGDVITTFSDRAGDAFSSDGSGSYVPIKKQQKVTSEVQNGQHWLRVSERSRRSVCVSFPSAGADAEIYEPGDWADLEDASRGAVGLGRTYCGFTTWHTRDHTDPGKLLDMDTDPATAVDDVQRSGGKMMLLEFGNLEGGEWEWRLFFDDSRTAFNGGDRQNGLCIRKNADDSWTIGNAAALDETTEDAAECDSVDEHVNLFRVRDGGIFTLVGRFRMPFEYTVQPLF